MLQVNSWKCNDIKLQNVSNTCVSWLINRGKLSYIRFSLFFKCSELVHLCTIGVVRLGYKITRGKASLLPLKFTNYITYAQIFKYNFANSSSPLGFFIRFIRISFKMVKFQCFPQKQEFWMRTADEVY